MTRINPRLYRVILPVDDIDRAQAFYETALGLPGERVSHGRQYFDCGGTILACFDPRADGDPFDARPNPDHVYLAVDSLEDALEQVRQAGAEPGAIGVRPWGERSFYAHDPFGNPLCFVQRGTEYHGGPMPG